MTNEQQQTGLPAVDTATSHAAASLNAAVTKLQRRLGDVGALGPDVLTALEQIGAVAMSLDAMARDEQNPVPVTVPTIADDDSGS